MSRGKRGRYAFGYSLLRFRPLGVGSNFVDAMLPSEAAQCARIAELAGCKPNPSSRLVHGVHVAWLGPPERKLTAILARNDCCDSGFSATTPQKPMEIMGSGVAG